MPRAHRANPPRPPATLRSPRPTAAHAHLRLALACLALCTPFASAKFCFTDCFSRKGCFLQPFGCTPYVNCDYALSYQSDGEWAYFELFGRVSSEKNNFVAVGLSRDRRMGNDSVIECSSFNNGPLLGRASYNQEKTNVRLNLQQSVENTFIRTLAIDYYNGMLYCQVARRIRVPRNVDPNVVFPLDKNYYVLMAASSTTVDRNGNGLLQVHTLDRLSGMYPFVSNEMMTVSQFRIPPGSIIPIETGGALSGNEVQYDQSGAAGGTGTGAGVVAGMGTPLFVPGTTQTVGQSVPGAVVGGVSGGPGNPPNNGQTPGAFTQSPTQPGAVVAGGMFPGSQSPTGQTPVGQTASTPPYGQGSSSPGPMAQGVGSQSPYGTPNSQQQPTPTPLYGQGQTAPGPIPPYQGSSPNPNAGVFSPGSTSSNNPGSTVYPVLVPAGAFDPNSSGVSSSPFPQGSTSTPPPQGSAMNGPFSPNPNNQQPFFDNRPQSSSTPFPPTQTPTSTPFPSSSSTTPPFLSSTTNSGAFVGAFGPNQAGAPQGGSVPPNNPPPPSGVTHQQQPIYGNAENQPNQSGRPQDGNTPGMGQGGFSPVTPTPGASGQQQSPPPGQNQGQFGGPGQQQQQTAPPGQQQSTANPQQQPPFGNQGPQGGVQGAGQQQPPSGTQGPQQQQPSTQQPGGGTGTAAGVAGGLVAGGAAAGVASGQNQGQPGTNPQRDQFTNQGIIAGQDNPIEPQLIKVHAILMTLSWMIFVSTAILFARFYRGFWPNTTLCGLFLWFHFHRTLNLIGIGAMIAGFVCIFVARDWQWTGPKTYWTMEENRRWSSVHSMLGLLACVIAWAQPLNAVFRCHPKGRFRFVYNIVHAFFGYGAWVMAAAALLIACMHYNHMFTNRDAAFGLCIAFIAASGGVFVFLELLSCVQWFRHRTATGDIEVIQPDGRTHVTLSTSTKRMNVCRFAVFLFFLVAVIGCAVAISVLIGLKDNESIRREEANFLAPTH